MAGLPSARADDPGDVVRSVFGDARALARRIGMRSRDDLPVPRQLRSRSRLHGLKSRAGRVKAGFRRRGLQARTRSLTRPRARRTLLAATLAAVHENSE